MSDTPAIGNANELTKERFKKYEAAKALGVDPFGGKYPKEGFIQELLSDPREGRHVRVAGRLTAVRVMGKSTFCDLRDETARIQIYVKQDSLGEEGMKLFLTTDIGDILGVEGELFKTRTGEISIKAQAMTLLAKSLRPMPEKWHGLKDVETRYRQRYLDLMSNEESREIFRRRSLVVRSIRRTLDERGYLEVETPMMHPIPGGAAGKPFKTHHEALDVDLYLRVAPELYLKKLLVGGFDRVYEINKSFRNEGISTRHNPEFTMLEVYTAYHDVEDVMKLCEELVRKAAADTLGTLIVNMGSERKCDLSKFERLSFATMMKESFGIEPSDSAEEWITKLKKHGHDIQAISRTQVINIVGELLEGSIRNKAAQSGVHHPIFVTDYFADISPLARRNRQNPHLAERFELYIGGMEVANGYSEQNDPIQQRERFLEELRDKGKADGPGTIDEDFLTALEHGMPPAGGLGIGIDRLVMILTNQPSIREVILFPQMKPEKRA